MGQSRSLSLSLSLSPHTAGFVSEAHLGLVPLGIMVRKRIPRNPISMS